jgi:hypothetical protein
MGSSRLILNGHGSIVPVFLERRQSCIVSIGSVCFWVHPTYILTSTSVLAAQLWSVATTVVQLHIKIQLNTMLFAKTLVRKSIASTASSDSKEKEAPKDGKKDVTPTGAQASIGPSLPNTETGTVETGTQVGSVTATGTTAINGNTTGGAVVKKEEEFSSKAQVMTLMTTDVDRVSDFSWHLFSLVDSPIEIIIGGYFLYVLLGVSAFWGLAASLSEYCLWTDSDE